jgi:hypothetical protein
MNLQGGIMIARTVTIREDQDKKLLRIAAQRQLKKETRVGRSEILREYLDRSFALSDLSIAALTQVAKDEGLDNLDEAVEHLVRNGG